MSWCIAVKSCRCRKNAHVWVKLNFCLFSTREWFSTSSGYCDHPVGCQKSLFSEVCWWTSYKKNWQGLVAEHSDLKSMFLSKLLKLLRAKQLNLHKNKERNLGVKTRNLLFPACGTLGRKERMILVRPLVNDVICTFVVHLGEFWTLFWWDPLLKKKPHF